ncbi:nucleotide pyrophosphohydrolase [Candidatus Woesearchaeota archaeon]|nr:nucleotide pyrophosphohydrolase [Candidatus Woesearchaeota archaeon]
MAEDFYALIKEIKAFNKERDWDQYHNPKDLLIAMMSEVGELADLYRWLEPGELETVLATPEKKTKVSEELADIFSFLIILAYKNNIDLLEALKDKLEKNKKRFDPAKMKGVHSNVLEGFKR